MSPALSNAGLAWCCVFAIGGPISILLSNHIFNKIMFPFPIVTSAVAVWSTAIVAHLLVRLGFISLSPNSHQVNLRVFTQLLLPIGCLSASSIALGNHALLILSVSFAQMLKAVAPVYIIALLFGCNMKIPSKLAIGAVFVISSGTAVASIGQATFSPVGMAFQMFGDFLEAVKIVLIQIILNDHQLSVIDLVYYVTPITGVFQILLISMFEAKALDAENVEIATNNWQFFAVLAVIGVVISTAGPQVIKVTSALTLKLIGIVRNNLLVLAAMNFLGEKISHFQFAGYLVSSIGFFCYTVAEACEEERISRVKIIIEEDEYLIESFM